MQDIIVRCEINILFHKVDKPTLHHQSIFLRKRDFLFKNRSIHTFFLNRTNLKELVHDSIWLGILSLCESPWKRKKKKWNKINILTVKLPWSALFPLCLIMWSLAKSQLLLHPWQIDTDDINNIITSVTICEINHNMKTSNHLSWILQACILLRTVGEKMHLELSCPGTPGPHSHTVEPGSFWKNGHCNTTHKQ